MESKTLKNTIKPIKIIIVALACILVWVFIIFLITGMGLMPVYFPHQEKEKIVKIKENNNEARIYIYLNLNQIENIDVQIYDNDELLKPFIISKDEAKKEIHYTYMAAKEENYSVKIKNKTNSILFSNIKVYANN